MNRRDAIRSMASAFAGPGVLCSVARSIEGLASQQRPPVDLRPFCGSHYRFDIESPWRREGWEYATTGAVAVRIAAAGPEVADGSRRVPRVESLPWDVQGRWRPWPEPVLERGGPLTENVCPYCRGFGRTGPEVRECVPCEGFGHALEHEPAGTCEACAGRGSVGGPTCDYCGGHGLTGRPWRMGVGRAYVAGYYGLQIARLPDAEWLMFTPQASMDIGKEPVIAFRFDGGQGFLMPLIAE